MNLKKGVPVSIGGVQAVIFGGPFRDFVPGTRRLKGIKMAVELDLKCDVSVPTEDYGVPTQWSMDSGLIYACSFILKGNDVYAGCMGGSGRTGLFMGCLVKCLNDYALTTGAPVITPLDPVAYVRITYKGHAIETPEQEAYVRNYDSTCVLEWLTDYHDRLGVTEIKYVDRLIEAVPEEVYPSLGKYLRWWLFGR